ncbi:MAG: betaine/proline/choline family ABC transporter ATP-binding protein [Coriobacteriia bacterium]|nr:betaine/proline/choline family ABC transporter ATP-binding protein [Coriobacteriia bacterium]
MIRLEGVTKRYGDTVAVDDLTLEVPSGEVCVLIGPSGCGKTTTLRMINRLVEPTSGRIEVDGSDIMSASAVELRRHIGYAIQSVGLFPHLTVAGNIATVPKLLGWKRERIERRVAELLDLVGLDPAEYGTKYPRQLSGGEAQRIGVARALAADPPLLLMDEPFGAVDPLTRERLQAEFARIQRELRKTVIFVTHDVDEAIRLADRVALMRDGRLQQYETPEALIDHPANKFVHDFMGADRALKRLGRVSVDDVMRAEAPMIRDSDAEDIMRAACGSMRFVYVVDAEGVLLGWMDCVDVAGGVHPDEAITRIAWREAAVQSGSSLKEALSLMLALGFRSVAVVDGRGALLGEIGLADIESTMTAGDSHMAQPTEESAGEESS